jgi:hypothetical protein
VPTLIEQGLDIDLANWRAVVAPPGLSRGQRAALVALLDRMVRTATWRNTLTRFGWTDAFLSGDDFETFLDDERVRIGRIVTRLRGASAEAAAGTVGEWAFPAMVIGGALLVVALLALRDDHAAQTVWDGRTVGVIIVALAVFAAIFARAGFVPAGSLLFTATAHAFGSRRWVRDALAGIVLCAGVYVAFTQGLGIGLP